MNQPHGPNDPNRRRHLIQTAAAAALTASVIVAASSRIAARAGYKPGLALWMLVSPVNLFLLVAFASREWPVQRELRRLKTASAVGLPAAANG